jgi:hypothetical protein
MNDTLFPALPDPWPGLQRVSNTPPPAPDFDGHTYDRDRDGVRLRGLLGAVYDLMRDHRWRTVPEIHATVGGSEAGVSARLRDLRKDKFGGHGVDRRRKTGGLWEYRIAVGATP